MIAPGKVKNICGVILRRVKKKQQRWIGNCLLILHLYAINEEVVLSNEHDGGQEDVAITEA